MNALRPLSILVLAGLAATTSPVFAQTAAGDPGAPPAPVVRTAPGGVEYVNGGAGAEAQEAIGKMQSSFALKLVFATSTGAYAVADRVSVTRGSASVLDVERAGPLLLVKLPPGSYRVEATAGGRTEGRDVRVGGALQTLTWRIEGS